MSFTRRHTHAHASHTHATHTGYKLPPRQPSQNTPLKPADVNSGDLLGILRMDGEPCV